MDKIEAAKVKLAKAKEELSRAKKAAAKEERRVRDTALYTVGGCFAALLEHPDTKDTALKIWNGYLSKSAPTLFTDRRRQALEDVFDLTIPDITPFEDQSC